MVLFISLVGSAVLASFWVSNTKQAKELDLRQRQVIEALKQKDKHDLDLSRELNLGVKDVHRILSQMEKKRLVRSYWGGVVLMTRGRLRYRFYALDTKSHPIQMHQVQA